MKLLLRPALLLKYQLYLFQLEEYDISHFFKTIVFKGLLPKSSLRKDAVWTNKALMLAFIAFFLQAIVSIADSYFFGIVVFKSELAFLLILLKDIYLVMLMSFVFLIIAELILTPFENYQKNKIIERAKIKLANLKKGKLKVVGITGSYGKTSMKETLESVLGHKFRTVATPENNNTPLGISRAILNLLNDQTEIFVVEMGEYYKGDVDLLCKIAPPDISLITGINEAHLEKYGTMQNAIDTKFEIVENTPEDGFVILNADDKLVKENYGRFIGKRDLEWYSYKKDELSKYEVVSKSLDLDSLKQKFEIDIDGENINIQTSIIAEYIGGNIVAAIVLGLHLGMSLNEIKFAISNLKAAPHRLEATITQNNIIIIDDTYNGNSDGIREGINLLSKFVNRRKVYVTPGLVETGSVKEQVHLEIGKQLAKVADLVILTKNSATPFIEKGLKDNGFSNIVWYENSKDTYAKLREHLKANDVVMMQNDWSDNYY